MAGDFGGELFVGRIEAGKPVAGLGGFALGPEMGVFGLVTQLGRAEVKTLLRRRAVGDGDAGLAVGGNRLLKGDNDVFVRGPNR